MQWTPGRLILLVIGAAVLLGVGFLCGYILHRDNERDNLVKLLDIVETDARETAVGAPGTPLIGPQLPEHNHPAGQAHRYGIHGCPGCAADAIRRTGPRTWDTDQAEQLAHTVDKLLSTSDLSAVAVQIRIADAYTWLAELETPAEVVARLRSGEVA